MKTTFFSLLSMVLSTALLPTAFSQETGSSQETVENAKASEEEKMSVVGSRIRRFDLEGAAPAVVITGEEIEKSGFQTVGQVLQNSTSSPYGGAGYGGISDQINVRGLGSENTLVLINGKRVPKVGSVYGNRASSVNNIPTSAIKRVEVLTDGGSAIYGSEALASVINIVTDKNIDGVKSGVQHNSDPVSGSNATQVYSTYGKRYSKGYFGTSLEYIKRPTSYLRNHDFTSPDFLRDRLDNYSTNNDRKTPFPSCREVHQTGICRQYYGDIRRTSTDTASMFSEISHKLNSTLSFNADIMGHYRKQTSYSLAALWKLEFKPTETEEIRDRWGEKLKNLDEGEVLTIAHRIKGLESKRTREQYTLGTNIGVEGDWGGFLAGDWSWSLNNSLSRRKTVSIFTNMALLKESKEAIRSGQYSPFQDGPKDLTGMLHDPKSKTSYLANTLDFSADGTLLEIGNSTSISMAMGTQLAYHGYNEQAHEQVENENTSGLGGINGENTRTQQAIYGELGISHANWMEGQLAARLDRYSDFGVTFNPKLALQLRPSRWLMLRSSVGTGFKAPELADLSDAKIKGFGTAKDYKLCQENPEDPRYCYFRNYRLLSSGNPNLKEETSLSYNVGFGLSPIPDLNIVVDYWNYRLENQIGRPIDGILKFERDGRRPEDYGYTIVRDEGGDPGIDRIIAPLQNLGTQKTDGIDLKIGYSLKGLTAEGNYSFQLNNDIKGIDGVPFESSLDNYGVPRYRYDVAVNYEFPGEEYHLEVKRRTIASYKNRAKTGRIPENSQYDLTGVWESVPWGGELTVGVKNLFNQRPEFDKGGVVYMVTSLHDPYETYFLRYDYTF